METGLEKIIVQRIEKQIGKHGFTGEHHANHPEWYAEGQLVTASYRLSKEIAYSVEPKNWDSMWWIDLCMKPYIERLSIAGSFMAAEIDRLIEIDKRQTK